jgi:hypothetical protein
MSRRTTPIPPTPDGLAATVVAVRPSRESAVYARLELAFANRGAAAVEIRGYRVSWAGGARTVAARFAVAAGSDVTRTVRVTPADGNIAPLFEVGAKVVVDEVRVVRVR